MRSRRSQTSRASQTRSRVLATGVNIRDLRPDHWPEIARIYAEGIATGNATFETDMPSWEVWDGVHLHHPRLVGTVAGEVVAWAAVAPVSSRPVYSGVADRGASVRIPHSFVESGHRGYLEDRRPNSMADPYRITGRILQTIDSITAQALIEDAFAA